MDLYLSKNKKHQQKERKPTHLPTSSVSPLLHTKKKLKVISSVHVLNIKQYRPILLCS
jgi:hypothetical protein